ncbi:MAG: hypothetical protein Q9160_001108 [Pyrenula sp. 1 TL-2023]
MFSTVCYINFLPESSKPFSTEHNPFLTKSQHKHKTSSNKDLSTTISPFNNHLPTQKPPKEMHSPSSSPSSSRSISPTPSHSSSSITNIPTSALAHAISTSLSALQSAQTRGNFQRVTQTTILHNQPQQLPLNQAPDSAPAAFSEKIEIAITASQEPVSFTSDSLDGGEEIVVKAEAAMPVEEARNEERVNEVLQQVPKRIVPRRGMSSDYGIGF